MSGLPDDMFSIRAELDGFAILPPNLVLQRGDNVRRARLVAHRLPAAANDGAKQVGGTLPLVRGVLEPVDGLRLGGQELLFHQLNGLPKVRVTTDIHGTFQVRLPVDVGTKCVARLGRATGWVLCQQKADNQVGFFKPSYSACHEFALSKGAQLRLRADRGVAIEGVLVGVDERPAARVAVRLEVEDSIRRPRWLPCERTTSDRDGRFRFLGIRAPTERLRVVAGENREGLGQSKPFRARPGDVLRGLDFVVSRTAAAEGVLLDARGKPLPGARLWVFPPAGVPLEALSNRQGRFRFVGVEPGEYRVEAFAEARTPAYKSEPFEIQSGQVVQHDIALK